MTPEPTDYTGIALVLGAVGVVITALGTLATGALGLLTFLRTGKLSVQIDGQQDALITAVRAEATAKGKAAGIKAARNDQAAVEN